MAQWECIVCGLIYDEKDGWPEDGIAPGTKWADVPDDWTCPDCGVGKDDFELIPGTEDEAESEDASASSDTGPSGHPIVVIVLDSQLTAWLIPSRKPMQIQL